MSAQKLDHKFNRKRDLGVRLDGVEQVVVKVLRVRARERAEAEHRVSSNREVRVDRRQARRQCVDHRREQIGPAREFNRIRAVKPAREHLVRRRWPQSEREQRENLVNRLILHGPLRERDCVGRRACKRPLVCLLDLRRDRRDRRAWRERRRRHRAVELRVPRHACVDHARPKLNNARLWAQRDGLWYRHTFRSNRKLVRNCV
mmetsp:Transcript_10430/g.21990  ORF Transcript_10430/g.21990 Transcript_10430/m.21990 type:complete len:203 (-) Transcript_10430:479-1087(-)|eukprot:CAMPEP_0185843678 /NCGR_PEP_ID=MMETSP1354-20130828/97_1 /TAXON_ID=708628 /ORGANISM="Erythrolobus madagascarensis, Strain CCMP3276" /LENGTH=202 /DNA_ID=CAMNT_0028543209 /DNA_START=115 /DNA_END=723 /DNA_ORIENTATION=+